MDNKESIKFELSGVAMWSMLVNGAPYNFGFSASSYSRDPNFPTKVKGFIEGGTGDIGVNGAYTVTFEEAVNAVAEIASSKVNTPVVAVMVICGKKTAGAAKNIFRIDPVTSNLNGYYNHIGFIPIVRNITSSFERISMYGYDYIYMYDVAEKRWMNMPCEKCMRYTHCSTTGVVAFNDYSLEDCPGFSLDSPVPPGGLSSEEKIKMEIANAKSYKKELRKRGIQI